MYRMKPAWSHSKISQAQSKKEVVENLVEDREKLQHKQLEALLEEELAVGTRLWQIQHRNHCLSQDESMANALYSSLARIKEERRRLQHTFWREKMQLTLMQQDAQPGGRYVV